MNKRKKRLLNLEAMQTGRLTIYVKNDSPYIDNGHLLGEGRAFFKTTYSYHNLTFKEAKDKVKAFYYGRIIKAVWNGQVLTAA